MNKSTDLTTKQLRAIHALLQTISIKKAAQKSGVSRSSITRWLNQPVFKAELERRRLEIFNEALNILKLSSKWAAMQLVKFLNSKDPALVKWATREILNFAIRAAEIQDIEKRLERLEDKLI